MRRNIIPTRHNKKTNPAHPYRLYESEFPGEQTAPLEFWSNEFGGNVRRPVLTDFTVVGYDCGGHKLYLRSKTGDSSDSIAISFIVDTHNFQNWWMYKKASFAATLEWDNIAQGWYYQWTCTRLSF